MIFHYFSLVSKAFERFIIVLCAVCTGLISLIIFVSVLFRYLINSPLVWSDEASLFLFGAITFFGAALTIKHGSMIAVDLLIQKLSGIRLKVVNIISQMIILLFFLTIFYFGYQWIISEIASQRLSTALRIPVWIPYSVLPLSMFFTIFFSIDNIIKAIRE